MPIAKSHLLILVAFPFALGGCVGIGALYPQASKAIENPKIGAGVGEYYENTKSTPLTCSEVRAQWGVPSQQSTAGTESTMVYKRGLVWAGVMPIVVVPIPIALPVGRKTTTMTCKGNTLVRAIGTETGLSAAYCGMISERPEYGCRTE